jgi:hypothetical protein
VAFRLHRLALSAKHVCFHNFTVDGVVKRVSQGPGLWAVMRANCPDSQVPSVTLEFDYHWPDSARPLWAAVTVQVGWGDVHTIVRTVPRCVLPFIQ